MREIKLDNIGTERVESRCKIQVCVIAVASAKASRETELGLNCSKIEEVESYCPI